MVRKFCLTLAVVCTAFISKVSAQQTEKVTSSGIGYLEYLPQGYHNNSNKYPVVISLHGIKEKGTSSTDPNRVRADLNRVDNVGLPRYVKSGKKYPFILISPQLKSNHGLWPPSYVIQVLNHVKKYLRIDERRIYLTGLSLGGYGVWKTAGEYPEVFAAIAPICAGGNDLRHARDIAAQNVAVWGFHGDADRIVSHHVTTNMVNAINAAPKRPNSLAKATIFRGMGHNVWDKAYEDTNVLDWLLTHRKGSAPPKNEDKDDDKPSNKAPDVKAGPDRTLVLPASSIAIQGEADDPDGKITSLRWTKISGSNANLSGTNSPRLTVSSLKEGTYLFRLTATDNDGTTRSDDMSLIVKKSSNDDKKNDDKKNDDKKNNDKSKKNTPPTAYSGPDLWLTLPTNSATVHAKASDKDGKIVSYEWSQTYGNRASISGANTPTARISNLDKGIYIFRLRVKDDDGAIKDDLFKITVDGRKDTGGKNNNDNNDKENKPGKKSNQKPNAYAGPDRWLTWPTNSVSVHAEASDKDGRIVSYHWEKTSGRRANVSGSRSSRVNISNLERGIYIFRLTVKDNEGAATEDYFKITVR